MLATAPAPQLDVASGVYDALNSEGQSALDVAIRYEDVSVVSKLMKAGANVTDEAKARSRTIRAPTRHLMPKSKRHADA